MDFGFGMTDFITIILLANKLRKDITGAPAQFKAIAEEVRGLSIVLQDADILTERSLSRAQAAELSQVATACTNLQEELQVTLERYRVLERRPTDLSGKLKKAWKRVAWEPDDVRDIRGRITSNVTILEALNGRIIRNNTFKLVQNQEDLERKTILDWLISKNYSSQHSDFIERREPGTGEWFLESKEYGEWATRSSPTLFSPGIPGSGKTILASIVIDDLLQRYQPEPNVGIAFIYLNFRQQEEQRLQHLLSSLLKQLLHKRPTLPVSIRELHSEHVIQGTRPTIAELSAALNSVVALYTSVFIVVDALDECRVTDGCRQDFIHQLLNLQLQKGVSSQLFVTSRFIPEITEHFEDSLTLPVRASEEDVRKYIDSNLSRLSRCVRDDKELQSEIKQEIVNCVDGMFLLAQLHLDSLKGKKSRKAIRTALQSLPSGSGAYDYAYDEAMARIDGQLQDEKEMAIDVLLWISSALRPLKVAELEHALAVEIGGPFLDRDNLCPIEELVSVCAGLVTVDQESSIARLVHFTTQQYFERTRDKWFADADLRITSNCLTYLNFDDFGEGPCLEPRLFQDRLQNHPFYDYAATNWGNHAKKCGVEGAKAVDIFKRPDHVDSMSQALMASITWPLDEQFVNQFAKGMNGLHLAAFFGFQEMTEYHLDRGMPPDHADSHDRTPLCWAAMKGCFGIVKLLVGTRKVDPLRKDNNTRTPLSWASQGGFLDIVKLLLESDYNVDPDAVDDYGWTPLCWAAEYGREEVVKLFLSLPNVNPSFEDKNSRTPISWAAKNGHKEVVQLLFEATGGADADLPDVDGWAPLAFAADNGEDDITRFLIDTAGALPDRRDEDGRSALSWAAQYGHESTARLLMNYPDVQVSARELDGRTPLFWAAQYGNYNVVKCLLNAAPEDADIEDNSGWTPFCWAAEHRCMSVMELLLDVGKARPDSRDFNNRGPISWAAQVGHEDVVKMLLNRSDVDASAPNTSGATTDNHHNGVIRLLLESNNTNVDLKGYQGRTPLSTAAAAGNSLAVSLLLQADGVNVNSVDLAGRTPLSLALQQSYFAAVKRDEVVDSVETTSKTASSLEVQQGYREVVKALLDSPDIDVNKRDLAGWSPLHQVIMMCGRGFDWLLNSPKIDLNVRDSRGRTPLSHAASQQHGHDTVELLLGLQGVNVSSRDDTGCTPLYWAVHGRQEDAIELLLSSGRLPANIGELCVDKSGFSAVQLAAMNGDDKVVAMLMERGAVLPEDVFGLQSLLAYDEDAE